LQYILHHPSGDKNMTADKVRENRLRRKLDRMGYRLEKSRARDPDAITYGGFQIIDHQAGGVVAGWGNANRGFAFTLDDVERWVERD
jgi:hypothetical protein